MKQALKGGSEVDCVSKWRKMGIISGKSGTWKKIKQKMNKRFRKDGKLTLKSAEDTENDYE